MRYRGTPSVFLSLLLMLLTLMASTGLQAQAGGTVSIADDGKCYGPDCEWYQKLLNTLEEAEDKARSAQSCMKRILELEETNRESLRHSSEITHAQMDRTVLAYQTGKVLRSIAKGAWEAAMFLSGNPKSVVDILSGMKDQMLGSDETSDGSVRTAGMMAGDPEALKQEAIAQAKSKLKEVLESEGFPPSAAQGAADGVITTAVNSITAGNQGGFNRMLVADIAAQAINGYVQGLNEERKKRITRLEGDLSAESAAIAQASNRILALRGKIQGIDSLLSNIRTEKEKLEANARECRLNRRAACWDAYDQALASASKAYSDALKQLQETESKKSAEVDKAAQQAQDARERIKSAYEEIGSLEKNNRELLEQYQRATSDLEIAEESYEKAQQEASEFSRKNNIRGYTQTYTNLISEFHADRQRLRNKVKELEGKAKPIADRLAKLREGIDKDFKKLAEANELHKKLENELDKLREDNKVKKDKAAAAQEKAAQQAQTSLDACLNRASSGTNSTDTLSFTVTRTQGSPCDQLLAEAQAGFDAVRRNNHPKTIEIPCPGKEAISICPDPAANQPITVGANSEVGSSAKTTEKVTGMLGGAVGGLLGGVGFGGGGVDDDDTSGDPEIVDDPIDDEAKKEFVDQETGNKILVGGTFNDKGLLISSRIVDAAGDGTFHKVFLEDPAGNRGGPIGYFIYAIYSEWNLTVSWTRDRWVDGEHVEHSEGGWTEGGSSLETFKVPVHDDAIWSRLGFSHAVKGISSLGTQFIITKEQLKTQTVYLVVHITRPDQDPVTTVPFIIALSVSDNNELMMKHVPGTRADNDCRGKDRVNISPPAS